MMFAMGLWYMAFILLRSLYPHFLGSFYHKWVFNFVKSFFLLYIEMIIWFSFFMLLIWYITLIALCILKNPCISRINPTWSWLIVVYDPLIILFKVLEAFHFLCICLCVYVYCVHIFFFLIFPFIHQWILRFFFFFFFFFFLYCLF